ncbi:AraC-like DNA-binding protein [Krasilnikovia cinnamomea]|uniref:AraC-like DNA-binding protein n=1 Tax=Krasilnikovia cinnamomea TaxID=349313 RepID=A0A4Q7ZQR7_9ACTN|nr:AraC family transcriptional regulator [Krasilnikovia cinnamomea]RZU53457.1 AraC-like DNA-binding protein [Krasilnikovia cinnamomea]
MESAPKVVALSFSAQDVDDVRAFFERVAVPVSADFTLADRPFRYRYEQLACGPVGIARADCSVGMRIQVPDLQTSYAVAFADGEIHSRHRGISTSVSNTSAAIYRPVGEVRSHSASGCQSYMVTIEGLALESTLGAFLGRSIAGPVRFGPSLDLTTGPGLSWARLVRAVAIEAGSPDGLGGQPAVLQPLTDAILRGLLLAADHPDRPTLHEPAQACQPGPLGRAVDAIHADPAHPYTLTSLAAVASVGGRALQQGFREQFGVSPMGYLRQVRLARAHDELRSADPSCTGVAAIAHRWGFAHLGRFAGYYRAVYGCPPSVTLHG